MKLSRAAVKATSTISPIWIIPIVALLIAGGLAIRSWQEQGTEIEIIFASGSGIEVGQTQIRLKDVPVGKITNVRLSSDLSTVKVFAMLDRQVSEHLSKNSRFWLVEPRVSATGISNLGTLISGVYIVMDPGEGGRFHRVFKGLSEPPAIQSDDKGKQYTLQAESLGSLGIGSPIYYRELKVGEVTGYKLSDQGGNVEIRIFIEAPHDQLVLTKSRFWNVSGFNVSVGADGLKAEMASLASLISGGIAFENAVGFEASNSAENDHEFYLYDDRDSVLEQRYTLKYFYRLSFSHSVKGLSVGAPVEFRGIKIGEVVDIVLDGVDNKKDGLHVFLSMEPERLKPDEKPSREKFDELMASLVDEGMRASMKTASLITGSKFIDLSFPKNVDKGKLIQWDGFTEIPTLDRSPDGLEQQLFEVAEKINKIPIDKIGEDLSKAMTSLSSMLDDLDKQKTVKKVDSVLANADEASERLDGTLMEAETALKALTQTMESLDSVLAPDSKVQYELVEMLNAVNNTMSSLNQLIEKLNQKPDALILGN